MKIKSYLFAVLFAVALFSCSKDDENTIHSNTEKQTLSFDSEKAMQSKIAEIVSFKKEQEAKIMETLLNRNNLKVPSENDLKPNVNVKMDEKDF